MKKIKLFIDTSDKNFSKIVLTINGKKINVFKKENIKSQSLLPLIIKTLKDNNLTFLDLTDIEIFPGPGSFTGLRVGASIAQALAYVLNIKISSSLKYL